MQPWATEPPSPPPQPLAAKPLLNRPNSLVVGANQSQPGTIYSIKSPSIVDDSTLRRSTATAANHLVADDTADTLNRKSSSKSTGSRTREDTTRTDHDRSYPRTSRDSSKRKSSNLRPRLEESLEIYESLSESPV